MAETTEVLKEKKKNKTEEIERIKEELRLKLEVEKEFASDISNKLKCPLIPKKVKIVPLQGYQHSIIKDKNLSSFLIGTHRSIVCPQKEHTNQLKDPLEAWEREWLEKELGLDLNPNAPLDKNYYRTKAAKVNFYRNNWDLEDNGVTLDLMDPVQFIQYKICLIAPLVAKSWEGRFDNPEYLWAIKDEGAELVETTSKVAQEDVVLEYLLSNKNNKKKLYDLLRLYGAGNSDGRFIDKDASTEWLYTELRRLSKEDRSIKILYNIINLNEADLANRVLIEDAVSLGILEKTAIGAYKQKGGAIIGYSMQEAAKVLNSPEYNAVKLQIKQLIDKNI